MAKDCYYIALAAASGIGPARFKILIEHFKKAEKVWKARDVLLKEILGEKIFGEFDKFRQRTDPEKFLSNIESRGFQILTMEDKNYPSRLKEIHVPPPVLYLKGSLTDEDSLALAVVGSRRVTSYGREVTNILVSQLVQAGLTIVSGLARGVDSLAHRVALKNEGRTLAILGSGLDIVYPAENKELSEEIVKNGALISEFPLGVPPTPGNFPARNRIISGLSLGVLVTEADEGSGSLITAGFALEQNREVFAVPGPIYSRLSDGPSKLIKQGAKLAASAQDILEELNLDFQVDRKQQKKGIVADSVEEETIIKILQNEQKHVNQIIRESGFGSDKLIGILTTMELKGKVKNVGSGNYVLGS